MPTMLPSRVPQVPAKRAPQRHEPAAEHIDIWAVCVGLAATSLAGFIYFSSGDRIGATLILLLAAVVVLAMLRASTDAQSEH